MATKFQRLKLSSGGADASGDASNTSKPIRGKIYAICLAYDSGSNSGTNVAVDTSGHVGEVINLLDVNSNNTSGWYYPRVQLQDYQGNNLDLSDSEGGDTAVYGKFVVDDTIDITVDSQAEDKEVVAWIIYEAF